MDTQRRQATEVPGDADFYTKPDIALGQIRAAVAADLSRGVVRADAAYGINKYWISTLPLNTGLKALVRMAKHRWIIERDYQELKQELGRGHFEGRNWRGFHHHALYASRAYGFLVAERNRFPPLPAPVNSGLAARRDDIGLPPARLTAFVPSGINPNSIATLRTIPARQLPGQLPQCPFCGSRSG